MMPARKHNMFLIKLISIAAGVVGTVFTAFSINWGGVAKFGHSVNFLYENIDEIEHVLTDYHDVLGLTHDVEICMAQIDSLKHELFIRTSRDSLIHVIELFNRGKMPYDSIWRLSDSGHWYKTTVENHYKYEHND